jgi:hypothetical protein
MALIIGHGEGGKGSITSLQLSCTITRLGGIPQTNVPQLGCRLCAWTLATRQSKTKTPWFFILID